MTSCSTSLTSTRGTRSALRDQARSYSAPSMSIEDLLGRLASAGVPKFAAEARRHLWPADPADPADP